MLKKIKNKGGFTLIEILGAIVLLLILVGITIPVVSKYLKDGKDKYNDKLANEFLTVVKDYYADNPGKKPSGGFKGNISDAVWLTELQAKNYLSDELKDADGGSCYDTVGFVNYKNGTLNYDVCLRCENYSYGSGKACEGLGYADECDNAASSIKIKGINFYEIKPVDNEDSDLEEIEVDYNGDWISNNVIFKIITDKFGYLVYNDKMISGSACDDGYCYELTLENFVSKRDLYNNYSILGRCGTTVKENIQLDINIDKKAPNFEIDGSSEYILKPGDTFVTLSNRVTNSSDIGSGVGVIKYQYCDEEDNCTSLADYNGTKMDYNALKSGTYNLKVYVYDKVGNVTEKRKDIIVKNQINFELDGGSGTFEPIIAKAGSTVTLPSSVPVKDGMVFIEWRNGDEIYNRNVSFTINKSFVLTARYVTPIVKPIIGGKDSITVRFHCMNKGVEQTYIDKVYTVGSNDSFPTCPEVDGYNYIGWSKSNNNEFLWANGITVQDYWIRDRVNETQPIDIYSVEEPKSVKVTFVCSSDDKDTKTFTYDSDETQKFTKKCLKTGYDHVGWSRTKGGSKNYNVSANVVNKFINAYSPEITLYPVWEAKKVKVTFYCSSSTKPTQTFTYGVSGQKFSKTCSKTGLVLKGWSLQKNGAKKYKVKNGVADSWIDKNSPKITLYPVWGMPPIISDKCPNDKVAPVCQLVTSCHEASSGNGVTATFKCKDAGSSIKLYSIFAQTGWKESKFSTIANITSALNYKTSASKGVWKSYSPNWTTTTTPSNPPVKNKQYTFYFGAIDDCGNAIVIDNVSTSCKYN